MIPESTCLIYFSPTHTTQTVLEAIACGIQSRSVRHLDMTLPQAVPAQGTKIEESLAIIGVPVYGGRVPATAIERLRRISAAGTPAVVVAVFGNREFEDALLELRDLATELGFKPIAGGAFIGEHSFADKAAPIATGRPDQKDTSKAEQFGRAIADKMEALQEGSALQMLQIPGNFPYKEYTPRAEICAETQTDLCTLCETCAGVCPTGAITIDEAVSTRPADCILCCACVKSCPTGARVMADPNIKKIARWLSENFQAPKAPQLFF